MEKTKKITLFPTKYIKKYSNNAMGTATISYKKENISLNIYNLPGPKTLSDKSNHCYKCWLCNPHNDEVISLGELEPEGGGLYILYDIPFKFNESYTEIIITAQPEEIDAPGEIILLIGYLSDSNNSQPLEQFEPFSPPLPLHKWWKLKELKSEKDNPHLQCPYHPSCFHTVAPSKKNTDLGLPRILGTKVDDKGDIEYFVHGVPARFLRSEQPDQGQTGYLYWHPYYGIEEKVGALGYWLCYLEPQNNQIATPMGVTIPPN